MASTASRAAVAASATAVTLKAANPGRKGLVVYNDSAVTLYVGYGLTTTTTDFTYKVLGGGTYEMPEPIFNGLVQGIWDSASGNARVTEIT